MTYDNNDAIDTSYMDVPIDEAPDAAPKGISNPLPPGKHQVFLDVIRLVDSEKLQYPGLSMTFREIAPADRRIEKFQMLDPSPERAVYVKALFGVLWAGLPPVRGTGLADRLKELPDRCYEIEIKAKGQYTNVYVNRHLDGIKAPQLEPDGSRLPF
jgi:hypothetical protein